MLPRTFESLPQFMQDKSIQKYYNILQKKRVSLFLKRVIDLLLAFICLLVLSPILIFTILSVKLSSKGPVFFRQVRIGRYGKPFKIIKFRTMVIHADQIGHQTLTVGTRDPRITPVGSFLRRSRIDEMPQFINVLLGDMSIIGPRPELEHYVKMYTPEMRAALLVRPGLSGSASIRYRYENDLLASKEDPENYYREIILPDKMNMNLKYVEDLSVLNDIKLILKTLSCIYNSHPLVLSNRFE